MTVCRNWIDEVKHLKHQLPNDLALDDRLRKGSAIVLALSNLFDNEDLSSANSSVEIRSILIPLRSERTNSNNTPGV